MTKQEKFQILVEKIIELKKLNSTINTKLSIQTLQNEMDELK